MLRANAALLSTVACLGCGAKPAVAPQAAKVTLSEQAPPAGYVALRALSVQSGKGCGLLAERGSREDADQKLRIAAERLGATYVHVTGRREPRANHQCLEHEYEVSGVSYRPPSPAASSAPPAPLPPASAPALPQLLLDFEGDSVLGKPARSTERSSVALALAPGERDGTALSVAFSCSGGEAQGLLDVWFELGRVDLRSAKALTLRVKPDAAITLSASLLDAERSAWTQPAAPLMPGVWQTVTLELAHFARAPGGARGDEPGAPAALSALSALGVSSQACGAGRLLLDDVRLE